MNKLLVDLREPLGLVLAGTSAAVAIVLGLPLLIAILAGAAVLAVKVGAGAVSDRIGAPRITGGSAELDWMARAEKAVTAFRQLARSSRSAAIGGRFLAMGQQAHDTLELLRRLAAQTSTVGRMLESVDGTRLVAEELRLTGELRAAESDAARREIEISLRLIREQLAARRRLEQAKAAQMARLQSGVLALEGLVTRLAEVVALGETAGGALGAGDRVSELADELEGLRAGLSELDQVNVSGDLSTRQIKEK
jgi:hypothetical protein